MKKNKNYFITATDTNAGKTIITALIFDYFCKQNIRTITQKWIQTGNANDFNLDLDFHYDFANQKIPAKFKDLMCPYSLKFAGSPHLASSLENIKISQTKIENSYKILAEKFESVIIEGSGGVLVPYNQKKFMIDIVKKLEIPVILVVLNKLGAINHTLISVEQLKKRNIKIKGIIFNNKKDENKIILEDNIKIIQKISKIKILGSINFNHNPKILKKEFENIGKKLCK